MVLRWRGYCGNASDDYHSRDPADTLAAGLAGMFNDITSLVFLIQYTSFADMLSWILIRK